jgi:hypothetical protein
MSCTVKKYDLYTDFEIYMTYIISSNINYPENDNRERDPFLYFQVLLNQSVMLQYHLQFF